MCPKKEFTADQAKKIGEQLGINWSKFNVEQFRLGMDVELEHGRIDLHTNASKTGKRSRQILGKIGFFNPK